MKNQLFGNSEQLRLMEKTIIQYTIILTLPRSFVEKVVVAKNANSHSAWCN